MEVDNVPVADTEMPVKVYDDFRFPKTFIGNVVDHVDKIKNMQCLDDDVFILTYPKSGTHWIREIVHMIQTKSAQYCSTVETDAPIGLIEMDTINNLCRPRTLYTHMTFRFLPKEYVQRKGKIVAIFRDFKDMATSYFHFFERVAVKLPWQQFLDILLDGKMPYGCWFDWRDDLERVMKEDPDYPILIIKYENLQKDLKKGVKEVADFLDVNLDDKTLTEITNACTFEATKKAKSKVIPENVQKLSKDGKDPFFRKGVSGDWKNLFTVAQYEKVEKVLQNRSKEGSQLNYTDKVPLLNNTD